MKVLGWSSLKGRSCSRYYGEDRNPGIKQDEIMSVGWKWSIIAFMEPWFMMLIVRVSGKGNIKLNGQLRFQKQGNTRYIVIMEISLKWECFSRRERKVHVYIIPCMIH